jgi:hypothetical protein
MAPIGELFIQGGMLTPSFIPGLNILYIVVIKMEGLTESLPLGENFTPRGNSSPLGPTSPQGAYFALMGEIKNCPLTYKIGYRRTGRWCSVATAPPTATSDRCSR